MLPIFSHPKSPKPPIRERFFNFYIFYFRFLKNIFSIWKFTEIYPGRPAAGRPGPGRPAAGRQGFFRKKNTKNNCRQVPGTGRPAVGRPASLPYVNIYKGVGCPSPPIWLTKNPEKKKREGGVRERQSGEALSDFQAGDCR